MSPNFKLDHLLIGASAFSILYLGTVLLNLPPSASLLVRKHPGLRLLTCSQTLSGLSGVAECVTLCVHDVGCVSGSFLATTRLCCLGDRYIYDLAVSFVADTNSVYFQPDEDTATHGNWTVAFRATTDNGQKTYYSFTDTSSAHHDFPVGGDTHPVTCWSPSASSSCTSHARSKILDQWNGGTFVPSKVKYTMYKNGAEVAYVVFNGTGSTSLTWMAKQRILSSSYSDVNSTQDYNFCSVRGFTSSSSPSTRRFFINALHSGCRGDEGWMVVVDSSVCSWEDNNGVIPDFLYSTSGALNRWNSSDTGKADVMAVLVQF